MLHFSNLICRPSDYFYNIKKITEEFLNMRVVLKAQEQPQYFNLVDGQLCHLEQEPGLTCAWFSDQQVHDLKQLLPRLPSPPSFSQNKIQDWQLPQWL